MMKQTGWQLLFLEWKKNALNKILNKFRAFDVVAARCRPDIYMENHIFSRI